MLKPNIGEGERLVRVLLGVYGMLLGGLFIQGIGGIIIAITGLLGLLSGITGWCGIYTWLGKSTITSKEHQS